MLHKHVKRDVPTTRSASSAIRVGPSRDPLEREADRAADAVMTGGLTPWMNLAVNPAAAQRAAVASDPGGRRAPPVVGDVLRAPGRSLPPDTRAFMESRLGHDFRNVRVHDDPLAAASAHALSAQAYTVGDHIVFAHGQYAPHNAGGWHLLAHELAHVAQQRGRSPGGDAVVRRQVKARLIDVERLPPEVRAEGVELPTASLDPYNPNVGVTDHDRQRSFSMKLLEVRDSPEYVDNDIVSVRPRGDVWTLEIFDLTFEYAGGRSLTVPWQSIDHGSAPTARLYERKNGVIYPVAFDGTRLYDAENTPRIAEGARLVWDLVVKASQDRLEMAELVHTFAGLIAASGGALNTRFTFSPLSRRSRPTLQSTGGGVPPPKKPPAKVPPKTAPPKAAPPKTAPEKTVPVKTEPAKTPPGKAPSVEKGPPSRTLGPGEDFAAHVKGSDGVLASLGHDGILDLYIKAGPSTPRGGEMFNQALRAYGSNVRGVRGTWLGGGELSGNFDSYKANIKAGMKPEQAAANTFTGKMSTRAGFTSIRIVSDTASKVVVEFTK